MVGMVVSPLVEVAVVLAFAVANTAALGCIGASGSAVSWFFAYKLPDGWNYAYFDAHSSELTKGSGSITDASSAVSRTLQQVHSDSSSQGRIAYNDEIPSGSKYGNGGHAKGVLASTTSSGFWLVHSLPDFPNFDKSNIWEDGSSDYGQTYLCVSVSSDTIEDISEQVALFHPHVYDSNVPSSISSALPKFSSLASSSRFSGSGTSKLPFSISGLNLVSFAKAPSWGQDLYEDFVEPTLQIKAGFAWETWRRSPYLPSYCPSKETPYPSINVQEMNVAGDDFSYTKDHSKWGVSLDSSSPYVCVGGINRMQSQRNRGGGTVCFQQSSLHSSLTNAIVVTDDPCSSSLDDAKADGNKQNTGHANHVVPIVLTIVAALALVALVVVIKARREQQTAAPEEERDMLLKEDA